MLDPAIEQLRDALHTFVFWSTHSTVDMDDYRELSAAEAVLLKAEWSVIAKRSQDELGIPAEYWLYELLDDLEIVRRTDRGGEISFEALARLDNRKRYLLSLSSKVEQADAAMTLGREHTEPTDATPPTPPSKTIRGVSLRDAAIIFNENDETLATSSVKRWRNSRAPTLPPPVGLDPLHSQTHLFDLVKLWEFLKILEASVATDDRLWELKSKLRNVRTG
jgi:hypothetical protein